MRCASHRDDLLSLLNAKYDRLLLNSPDWEEILRIADHAGVAPLLFHTIKHFKGEIAVPDKIYLKLKKGYQFNELRNALVLEEFDRLMAVFERENISSIFLKGIYFLKTIYRDHIGVRIMSDMDLLIKDEDWTRAGGAIESCGYMCSHEPESRSAAMYVKPKQDRFTAAPVHLHRHIVNLSLPFLNLNWSRIGMDEIWSSRVPLESGKDGNGSVMSPEHKVLMLCVHGLSHGFSRLTLLHDIRALVAHYRDTLDWEKQFTTFFLAFTVFLGVIGSFTLLVGGVGVASIMRVVVDERTREIGVKLAVGARRRTILWQFFSESFVIMLLGGMIGFGLSAAVLQATKAFPKGGFTDFIGVPVLNPLVIISTMLILLAIGIVAGLIPARTAASTDPIEALRK